MSASAQDNEKDTTAGATEERAGIAGLNATAADIAGSNDGAEEQIAEEAAEQERRQKQIEFLKWEELLEELKVVDPHTASASAQEYLLNYKKHLDENFANGFAIPRVADGSTASNGRIFFELLNSAKLYKDTDTAKSFLGSASTAGAESRSGDYDVSQKGIFFKAGTDASTNAKKPFTEVEARGIAILAMHNRDLLPPGSMRVTGKPEERAMILKEIDKLNDLLPENAKMVISNRQEIERSPAYAAPQQTATKTQDSNATNVDRKDPADAARAQTNSNMDDSLAKLRAQLHTNGTGNQNGDAPPSSLQNSSSDEAQRVEIQAADNSDDTAEIDSIVKDQHAKMQERLDTFDRDDILKHAKIVQETEDGQQAYAGKLRIEDAPKGAYTQVVFTAPEEGERKIISIAKTDVYAGYQSPDIKLKAAEPESSPRDVMHKDFVNAGAGDSPVPDKNAEKRGPSPDAAPIPGQP